MYGMSANKAYVLRTSTDVTTRGNGCGGSAAFEAT